MKPVFATPALLALVGLLVCLAIPVRAGEPAPHPGAAQPCRHTTPCWCPDRYRRKCPPRVCPPQLCGGGCYEPKCLPRLEPPVLCGGGGCYRRKCPPSVKIPSAFPPYYRCPPPACGK